MPTTYLFRSPLATRIWPKRPPTEGGGDRTNRLLDLYANQTVMFAGPGQVNTLQWENPVRVRRVYQPYHHRPTSISGTAEVGTTQPTTYDWPNPIRRKLPTDLFVYSQSYTVSLPSVPFRPVNEWPLPRRAMPPTQPQIVRLPPTTGIDQFFDAPGLAPTYDWPVPKGYRYPTSLYTWAQDEVSSKLVTLVPLPIKTKDWPNPVFPTSFVAMRGWADPTKLNLLGQDKFPDGTGQGSCYDWPNPRGYAYPSSLRTFTNATSYITAIPFSLSDYPNPVILKYPMDLRTFLQGYENFMLTGKTPFNQNDQPNPRGYPYPIDGRSWMQSYDLSLIGKDTFFGAAGESKVYDYPNPLRYKMSYACYDPNFGWFIVTVPPPPTVGAVLFRKTFSPVGTGVGARKRRKDS